MIENTIPRPGDRFDTPHERGCIATTAPDPYSGEFLALDSNGVECRFSLDMVVRVVEQRETCPVCGQPDNCGDCDHTPLTKEKL